MNRLFPFAVLVAPAPNFDFKTKEKYRKAMETPINLHNVSLTNKTRVLLTTTPINHQVLSDKSTRILVKVCLYILAPEQRAVETKKYKMKLIKTFYFDSCVV